jgi:hypothetical protein
LRQAGDVGGRARTLGTALSALDGKHLLVWSDTLHARVSHAHGQLLRLLYLRGLHLVLQMGKSLLRVCAHAPSHLGLQGGRLLVQKHLLSLGLCLRLRLRLGLCLGLSRLLRERAMYVRLVRLPFPEELSRPVRHRLVVHGLVRRGGECIPLKSHSELGSFRDLHTASKVNIGNSVECNISTSV